MLHWLWTEDPGRPLGVAGDSAGASLTAGLALRARDKQIPLAVQLMLYPATDPAMTSPSIAENGEGYFLTRRDMAWFYRQYLPAGPASAPEADLAHAEVAGVAPAIVATAEFDPLRDEGWAYAARLADAGVPIQYVPGPGLIHGFAAFLGVVDAADATVATILDRLTQALTGSNAARLARPAVIHPDPGGRPGWVRRDRLPGHHDRVRPALVAPVRGPWSGALGRAARGPARGIHGRDGPAPRRDRGGVSTGATGGPKCTRRVIGADRRSRRDTAPIGWVSSTCADTARWRSGPRWPPRAGACG